MPRSVPGTSGRRSRRSLWWAAALLVVLAAIGYLTVTALSARHDIQRIQSQLGPLESALKNGDLATAQPMIEAIQREAASAHNATTGPLWWASAELPWVGRPAQVVRNGSEIVHEIAQQALPAVATATERLDPSRLRHGDTIDLGAFRAAAPSLSTARAALDRTRRQADALPVTTWFPPANSSRTTLVTKTDALARDLDGLSEASTRMPSLLGGNGDRRYLVVFQNDAESRGLGGIPGAYAVLDANQGRLRFVRFGSDVDLSGAVASPAALPASLRSMYGTLGMTDTAQNATLSPDFPTDARVLESMVQHRLGLHVDGVLATDPTALAGVLAVTGPVTTRDGIQLTHDNLVQEVESTAYTQFASTTARKAFLVNAARAAAHGLLAGRGSTSALLSVLQQASAQRRLLAYSNDGPIEQWLGGTSLGGRLPATAGPFSALVVDNSAATKLDYYLQRSVSYHRTTCAAGETETVATLRNAIPKGPLPEYVSGHALNPNQPLGFNQLLLFLYATAGARLDSVTVNGKPIPFVTHAEGGHPVAEIELDMQPRTTYTVTLYAHEPATRAGPVILQQPLVQPEHVSVTSPDCA